jgi:hypothetical protein
MAVSFPSVDEQILPAGPVAGIRSRYGDRYGIAP